MLTKLILVSMVAALSVGGEEANRLVVEALTEFMGDRS